MERYWKHHTIRQSDIDQLIINSPYEEPTEHWNYHRETRLFTREPERPNGRLRPRFGDVHVIRRSRRFSLSCRW